jgi:hypothetical protein
MDLTSPGVIAPYFLLNYSLQHIYNYMNNYRQILHSATFGLQPRFHSCFVSNYILTSGLTQTTSLPSVPVGFGADAAVRSRNVVLVVWTLAALDLCLSHTDVTIPSFPHLHHLVTQNFFMTPSPKIVPMLQPFNVVEFPKYNHSEKTKFVLHNQM